MGGGQLVSIGGRIRELVGLTRTEAIAALEQEMHNHRVLQRALARLLSDPIPPRMILHRMRLQLTTALLAALFLGVAIGALLAEGLRLWSYR